jgi:nitrogen regulatory protein P-II 1
MKEIKAIIQPFLLDTVLEGLRDVDNLPAVTVSDVRGYSMVDPERGPQQKTKLEIMVPDEMAEIALAAIQSRAHTGNPGDGRIFLIDIRDTVKIRTGERGTAS